MARAPLVPHSTLGPFTLEQKLAVGGMAEIWAAQQVLHNGETRRVALKVMMGAHAPDTHFRDMFMDEVSIACRLEHPNIVRVYSGDEVEGHLLQVLERVDGIDVRRLLSALSREGVGFPVPFALMIARDMARGLAYAHQCRTPQGQPMNIVHRDVSPHNVMVTRAGHAQVLDFGIARAEDRLARTRTGVVKGKLAYMAPEQAQGFATDARTDIFSAGVVLWEMLAMRRLFRAESDTETLRMVVNADVPPIRGENPDVPDEAAAVLHTMLAAHPEDRLRSMYEVERSLNRAMGRNYAADQVRPAALAAWISPYLTAVTAKARRKTMVLPAEQPEHRTGVTLSAGPTSPSDPSAPTDPDPTTRVDIEPPVFE
ncbi:MAG: serine/threonine protein kinase [Deltaproteobacteria bacterium]|nr:serine/threonine protein kinase [Deltaproteobacteria bacterium]